MGNTIDDYFYEQHLENQYFSEKIEEEIENYKKENLKIFYLQKSHIYKKILEVRKIAQNLKEKKFLAPSFIYFNICIELIFRDLFIRPIVYGALLDEEIAEIIINKIFKVRVSRFDKLLIYLVQRFSNLNMTKKKISGKRNLWQELKELREIRNGIIHKGNSYHESDISRIESVLAVLLDNVIPKFMDELGLKLNRSNLVIEK